MWTSLLISTLLICLNFAVYAKHTKSDGISCKDEDGNAVDWFYLYKLPGKFGDGDSKGQKYIYFTSESTASEWIESEKLIGDADSVAGQTVSQAYGQSNVQSVIIAYNDEPPTRKGNPKKGHTKGLVVADDRTGFWLVHSVPLYINITDAPDDYTYPKTGHMYGQSFLCLSLDATGIDIVGKQLLYNEPDVYASQVPDDFEKIYPNIVRLNNDETIVEAPYWNQETITTRDGATFQSFAKSSKFHKDLYEDWVAPTLNVDLYVEAWIHGPGILPSNCSRKNHVWNVSQVKINNDVEFPTTDDHSKWGVGDSKQNWICVGDINRAQHQKSRGGGTVCQRSSEVSQRYRTLINGYEPCERITN